MRHRAFALLGVAAAAAMCISTVEGCGGDSQIQIDSSGSSGSSSGGEGGAGGSSGSSSSGQGGVGGAGGGASSSSSGMPGECAMAADCDAAFGASPCGVWACNGGQCEAQAAGCVDVDKDGYGSGAGCACAGIDCDDNDDKIGGSAVRSCYSGPAGTDGVGTCKAGTESCTSGVWSPCAGEITPSGEACNQQDDDCNGMLDDNLGNFTCGVGACAASVPACTNGIVGVCTPTQPASNTDGPVCDGIDTDCDGPVDEDCAQCIPVSLTGNDLTANGTVLLPFATVQAAINWAVANPQGSQTVCVAAGAACGATGTYANAAGSTITMANGVSVLGNYESTLWTRCAPNSNTTTVLQPKTAEGVLFPATVQKATAIDGFKIDRHAAPTIAGITVNGAKNAIISSIQITNQVQNSLNSYGVDIKNGGEATITKSRIDGGIGTVESIGVRSIGGKVTIDNNCISPDATGHCDDGCQGPNPSIRGRTANGPGTGYGILLQDSPNSSVEVTAVCAGGVDTNAGIRIAGDGTGILIRGNSIQAFNGVSQSHGVWMEECGGAAPWIVDNWAIAANGSMAQTLTDAVRAIGDCHPVVDSNLRIAGGGEGMTANTTAVHCGANVNNVASQCIVIGNKLIQGSANGFPPTSTGVRCDNGGCLRVANNIITGRGGVDSIGVFLQKTGTTVDNNVIRGGCGSTTATGISSDDSYARLQNNRVFGYTTADCVQGMLGNVKTSTGLRAVIAAGTNEIDVHSNDFVGGDSAGACDSSGIAIDVGAAKPAGGVGIFRNNILLGGTCATSRVGFREISNGADPRIFQNNNIDVAGNPTALYYDEGANAVASAASINLLVDMTVSGVISAGSLFMNFPMDLHIQLGSPCDGAGTPTGAPQFDMDSAPRDAVKPDIGADER